MLTYNSFAQKKAIYTIAKKIQDTLSEVKPTLKIIIKSYYVEENINMKFGGYITTYEVSLLSLINTCNLGPNNTRIITPRYVSVKQLDYNQLKANNNLNNKNLLEPIKTCIIIPQYKVVEDSILNQLKTISDTSKTAENKNIYNSRKNKKYINIHLIETYQRIADKGIKSIEIFQKLGDAYFFVGEYTKAAKWYEELFKLTTDLDFEYFDRYIYSLRVLDKTDKANEIIKKCNLLFGSHI